LFSYNVKPCLTKEEAKKAFDEVFKFECYVFYRHANIALLIENSKDLCSNDFEFDNEEVYVIDKNYKWTYMKTHEESFGPYYLYR